jgi:hypothetical protein
MIDRVVADIPNAEHGFTLIFAAAPFPGHQYKLDWVRADEDGGIGIAPQNSIWKAGSVRRCFRYSMKRQCIFTPR